MPQNGPVWSEFWAPRGREDYDGFGLDLRDLVGSRSGLNQNLVRLHKSMTTSPMGCEQQIRRLPSAGFSSGSGP